ncbi:MAG TPA: hypothetical protein VGW38_10185 [Chloroflexota bacterium]|nr:hypothetical protein [Chloroflexota bacterium]
MSITVPIPADLLRELGLEPDERRLLDQMRSRLTPAMLSEIAAADHGWKAAEHAQALNTIVKSGVVPDPLPWWPREVLELIRWSEPDDPTWSPGGHGREGNVMRAFSCTVLLVAGGMPENSKSFDGENQTLVQLVASILELGPELLRPAEDLVYSRLLSGSLVHPDRLFFILGLLILLRLGRNQALTPPQWRVLAEWVDDSEIEARLESYWPDSGHWLIDTTLFSLRHERWKALARRAFGAPAPAGAELIAERISEWPP